MIEGYDDSENMVQNVRNNIIKYNRNTPREIVPHKIALLSHFFY